MDRDWIIWETNASAVSEPTRVGRNWITWPNKPPVDLLRQRGAAVPLLGQTQAGGWSTRALNPTANAQPPIAQQSTTCSVPDLMMLIAQGHRFPCILADPPWLYRNRGTRGAANNHYPCMTLDALCALPITKLAAPDAHLHLWVTNAFLSEALRLINAWGFEYRANFVWAKPRVGLGNYWRNSHELLLTAIRGNAKRFNDHNLRSWMEFPRGAHSAKPEEVRTMIERASVGPYLELFGRAPVAGWTVWGNEIERDLLFPSAAA